MNKPLIIVYSYHHGNTRRVASAMAEILHADVKAPDDVKPEELDGYGLIGFGAGIDSGKHYKPLLAFAGKLPAAPDKKAFIFSTSAILSGKKMASDHTALREILCARGYDILDEFTCKGFNTNSFLTYLGGMNKGRPNADDLKAAKAFADKLSQATILPTGGKA